MRHRLPLALSLALAVALPLVAAPLTASSAGPSPARTPFDDPGAVTLEDYLPASDGGFDEALPRPESVLGHEVGERFARHDLVVAWYRALAEASPRVSVVELGRTYEGRPQLAAFITSSGNQSSLNRVLERHLDDDPSAPIVTWHGYSVHGNESSGVQASMAVAWYLAASQDDDVRTLLRKTVVIIDPSLNPDGYGRFSSWGNQASGRMLVGEELNRDRAEPWPGGRTNHYFFDLNRDWLLLQHPESRNRVRFLRQHRPHVMTDHHEMGADQTFFFQPGAPTRWNPLIPEANRRLTEALGAFHARGLDAARRLYYGEEAYDDFYPGKGSTWPDLQGTVGILFEQAGTRGLARDTQQGRITLPMAVHNHVIASLSTLRGSLQLADELKAYRRAHASGDLTPRGLPAGWIFDDGGDPARAQALLDVIGGHGLDVFGITETQRVGRAVFEPGRAWVVPVLGPRATLAHTLFAENTSFEDSTFYDVSGWSLKNAFGVRALPLQRMPTKLELDPQVERDYRVRGPRDAVAWVMPWNDYFAPAALHALQRAGVRGRVATESFSAESDGRAVQFEAGAVVIHAADVPSGSERPVDFLDRVLDGQATLVGLSSGLTDTGPELGSPRVRPLELPRVALLAGDGVNGYAAGAVWHQFDFRLGIPLSLIRPLHLNAVVLERHTHLIMVDGDYSTLPEETTAALDRWVNAGGVLITTRGAALWAQGLSWLPLAEPVPNPDTGALPYGSMAQEDGARQVGGAVLEVELDRTHPLAFGLRDGRVALMRRGRTELKAPARNPFTVAGAYTSSPLVDGYLPPGYEEGIAGRPAVLAVPRGDGVIIAFADDPAFRAVWWVGQRLLSNAVAFGAIIGPPEAGYGPPEEQEPAPP
jgi:hypothetical protein